MSVDSSEGTIFFLSPANLRGQRTAMLLNPRASFPLAQQVRSSDGAALGEAFSFLSGLYFRGKLAYARRFARAPGDIPAALVISPVEGLRSERERIDEARMRAWAEVDIDEDNPRYTEPLLRHAQALVDTLGDRCRFVLLGSVATDKYVRPLGDVFGKRLLFPPAFVGRGDMSRGSILLRAARSGQELAYAPVLDSARHRRPPTPRRDRRPQVVVLVGVPGAGKSTFYRCRFAKTHVLVSKDLLGHDGRAPARQAGQIDRLLAEQKSVVVDNTNATLADRAALVCQARKNNARVVVYWFDCPIADCLARNAQRQGRARIPVQGVRAIARRLVAPTLDEGFDAVHVVRPEPDLAFQVDGDGPAPPEGARR